MNRIIIIIILLSFQLSSTAQKKVSVKDIAVSSELGLLNGKSQVNVQMLATAGIQKKKYYVGLGSGFDYYGYRTIPVFIEGKKFFGEGSRRPFLYARSGMNVPWVLTNQQRMTYTPTGREYSTFTNGIYVDAGIGYTLYNSKGRGMFAGFGFCKKTLSESYSDYIWNGTSSTFSKHEAHYNFNNVQLRVGYKF